MKQRNKQVKLWVFLFAAMIIIMTSIPIIHGLEASESPAPVNKQPFPLTADTEQIEVEFQNDDSNYMISYNINGFNAERVSIEGETHYRLGLEKEAISLEKGYPDLPIITRSMIIPDDPRMDITVTNTEYVEYSSISIVPSKGNLMRTEHPDPSAVPYEFGPVYQSDAWYPQDIANLREPYILRDFRGQVVEIHPFQFNPVKNVLRVYTGISVEVTPVGRGGENILQRSRPITTISRDFARIYERRFINYDEHINSLDYEPVEEEGNMLVVSYDDFASYMDPFVDWKNTKGIPTELVTLSETGTTNNAIKDYIESYYNEHGLTYVLLVGDHNRVPTFIHESYASDPTYSFLDGDDYYPDILVGRFSALNSAHVETQVERSIYYEQETTGDWRLKGTGIACDEGPGYQDMMDWEFIRMLRYRLEDFGYEWIDEFYEGSQGENDAPGDPTADMVVDAFNDGRHIGLYCGHGDWDRLVTSNFQISHIHSLENNNLLPFLITVACVSGRHDYADEVFAEAWLRATNNGEPTGGIAAFSSARYQSWSPPMAAQDEMMHLYTETYEDNIKKTTGGIAFNGCMYMNDMYGSQGYTETAAWHLFGDPSADISGEAFIPGEPPLVNVTSPNGGEVWHAYDEEYITWETTEGDDPVDYIQLSYSTDNGFSWEAIASDLPDTGSYLWDIPNANSDECLVRVRAFDTVGRVGEDESDGIFEMIGVPPAAPQNLMVEHYGTSFTALFEDDVESGDLGYTTGTSESSASEWDIRQHGSSVGDNSWDFGDGEYYKTSDYGYLSWLISPGIEIPVEAENVELTFDHWRSFARLETYLDGGNLKISTTGVDGDYTLITPNEGYDGVINDDWGNPLGGQEAWGDVVGWETVTFDLNYYAGETVHLRWDAGIEAYDEDIEEGWRIDNIMITAETAGEGDDHNLLTWDASPDDPDEVAYYNIYRSEEQTGPWDGSTLVDSVSADGSPSYEYIDLDMGMADDIFWWYVVRAVGTNGLEEENEDAVQEPGEELSTFDINLYAGGDAGGWNFVSFNLIPPDSSLETILEDPDYGISGNYDRLMYYDASTDSWYTYVPGRAEQFNDLENRNHRMGVWIRMTVDDVLTIEGTEPGETSITLQPGWNMVGLSSSTGGNHGLPTEVSRIGYFDASQEYNVAYDHDPGNFAFAPGNGYWVYNDADYEVDWIITY